jgi:hypothetical protein
MKSGPIGPGGKQVVITPEGGLAVWMINDTGADSVKGTMVRNSLIERGVSKIAVDIPNVIGAIYDDGVADGDRVKVVVAGLAECLFIGNTLAGQFARGFLGADVGYITGYGLAEAFPTAPFASDKHFYEFGHIMSSRVGAGLALVNLHFN